MIRATCPIRAESLNRTNAEHWARRHKRNTSHRLEVYVALRQAAKWSPELLPCTVTMTRVAPRPLDKHDNLRGPMKSAVDAVADWLGVDDADPRVVWEYTQRRGGVKEYAVEIEILPSKGFS
jgi:hypothetical protein